MCITIESAMRISRGCEGTNIAAGIMHKSPAAKKRSAVHTLEWSPCADLQIAVVEKGLIADTCNLMNQVLIIAKPN